MSRCRLLAPALAILVLYSPVVAATPEGPATNAWAEIIAKAATSPLGIIALVVLVAGSVVTALFSARASTHARIFVVVLLLVFWSGLVVAAVYTVRPTSLPPGATKGAEAEGPAQEPPAPAKPPAAQPTPAPIPQPPVAQAPVRTDCGTAWTGWVNPGSGVGSPCPAGCERGAELGQSFRAVGLPPRPQVKHKFQCWRTQ